MANTNETYAARIQRKLMKKQYLVEVATGRRKADLVLKNASYVNVFSNELCHGDIAVAKGQIVGMGDYAGEVEYDVSGKIVCPGFIDAHIHLESSLVSPREFVRAVLPHGTTTVITDPHEITNVMGTDGIDYMLQATEGLPIDVRFMLPSCVPATPLDESGANLDYRAIDSFYDHARVQGLAEMMNYVGVVGGDKEVIAKIVAAQAHHKKIDGHAPGLSGKNLAAYIAAGVYSDHECSDMDDAMAKLRNGQFIMIRDGTAAHNLEALVDLLRQPYYDRCMFCTDDKPERPAGKGPYRLSHPQGHPLRHRSHRRREDGLPQPRPLLRPEQPRRHRAGLSGRFCHYRQFRRFQCGDGVPQGHADVQQRRGA